MSDNPLATLQEDSKIKASNQDAKNMAVLIWLGSTVFGFIPGLLFYLFKSDDAYVKDQAKEALNWSISAFLLYVAAWILTFVLIGALLIPLIAICHLVFCIMGVLATVEGKPFRVPYALRLIK